MIAGTSIGALVGGCYLAGKLDELESFARSLTMRRIAGLLDLTVGGSGLFGGMRLTKRMQEHLQGLTIEEVDKIAGRPMCKLIVRTGPPSARAMALCC